jgi:AmiR/NasT family two-component response regulator
MKTREMISQAVGILMAGGAKTVDPAFGMLTSASQRQNRKVRDIAEEIGNRMLERNG